MQEMRIKHHNRPLTLEQSRRKTPLRLHGVAPKYRKQNRFLAYFLSISFIGLLVRFFRVTRHILSFIITGMNNKKISRQQKIAAPHTVAVEEEKYLQPYEYSSEHETELQDHWPEEQVSAKRGLGLGLAICKDIVERHHGRTWCRSRVGKGSTFIVELPLNKKITHC